MDSTLKNVNTLKNVTILGKRAFERTQLRSVDLSDNLQKIDTWSFALIYSLRDIVIPDSVTDIGVDAFHALSSLKVYCNNIEGRCDKLFAEDKNTGINLNNLVKYEQIGSNFFMNGKWYESPDDILSSIPIKKRIYTVDEANKISGRKNTFKIRYK